MRSEVDAVTDASAAAIKMTLYRLKQSGSIVAPRRDFFVVVPREYRAAGCPPASWFIDDLMRHMGRRYYVGLLTAAALHGAGHQQPMAFQVMVDSAERDIEVGRVRIGFHMSSVFEGAATEPMQTETGMVIRGRTVMRTEGTSSCRDHDGAIAFLEIGHVRSREL